MFIGAILNTFNDFYKNYFLCWKTYPGSALSAPSFSFALCAEKMQMSFNCPLGSLSHQGEKKVEGDLIPSQT